MIGEEQQEQAALYALGLLTADEAAAFEVEMGANPELTNLERELRETAGHLVLGLPAAAPSADLRSRVLEQVAAEDGRAGAAEAAPAPAKVIAFRPFTWVPWAIAAGLAVFCGVLASARSDLLRELAAARAADPLASVAMYSLDPAGAPTAAAVSVAWIPGRQSGLLHVSGLAAPGRGKDYQLWAVDAASKDPISAGVVKIDGSGHGEIVFKPEVAASHVNAFAISVEPAGGSPKATGPIVFVGKE